MKKIILISVHCVYRDKYPTQKFPAQRPNLKNLSRGLNLSRGSNMVGST